MRTFVEELVSITKEELMELPKEFLLTLFVSYNDRFNVHLVNVDEDGLSVQLTKVDLWCVLEDSGTWDEFEAWEEKHGYFIDFSDC